VHVRDERQLGIRLAGHDPLPVGELVSAVVDGNHIHDDSVHGGLLESAERYFQGWKHPPETAHHRSDGGFTLLRR